MKTINIHTRNWQTEKEYQTLENEISHNTSNNNNNYIQQQIENHWQIDNKIGVPTVMMMMMMFVCWTIRWVLEILHYYMWFCDRSVCYIRCLLLFLSVILIFNFKIHWTMTVCLTFCYYISFFDSNFLLFVSRFQLMFYGITFSVFIVVPENF